MGRHAKPASEKTGHDMSLTRKKQLINIEQEIAGPKERLAKGLEGLKDVELKRLKSKGTKDIYDSIAKEAANSSALSNNHIHDLIDLANEYESIKMYNAAIKKYGVVVYDETQKKFSPNPADKMRKDSLKAIDAIKIRLGMRAVDIATLARQQAETGEKNSLAALFSNDKVSQAWEE